MKKLIINADDFGFNSNINRGIMVAYKEGLVTSTSLIVTKEGFEEAVSLAKENPKLGIGIHLDLDDFFLIDNITGRAISWLQPEVPIDKVKESIYSQIEKLLNTGLTIDHISSHHQVHLRRDLLWIVCEAANYYKIPVVRFYKKFYSSENEFNEMSKILTRLNILYTPHYIEGWYWGNIDEPFTIAELVTHPGYGEVWRECELSVCCDKELKGYINGKGIELITFSDFVKLCQNKGGGG